MTYVMTLSVTTIALFSALAAAAQGTQEVAFEVASVRPTNPSRVGSTFNFAPGELQIAGSALRRIMEGAYDLHTFQILGGPAWVDTDRYDISAKNDLALKGLSEEQRGTEMRRRLQTLLADRFQLKVHRETREMTEYALVVAKGGFKLKESDSGIGHGTNMNCGVMKATRVTMSNLAMNLSSQLGRPVLDRTGLSGRYDFELNYSPDGGCALRQLDGTPNSETQPEGPSIFTAIQNQLGLKLEAIKGPVEVIVIDHVEKPEAN